MFQSTLGDIEHIRYLQFQSTPAPVGASDTQTRSNATLLTGFKQAGYRSSFSSCFLSSPPQRQAQRLQRAGARGDCLFGTAGLCWMWSRSSTA